MSGAILVVDDMPYIREPIAASLCHAGYQARCAATGAEALSIILNDPPALVLLDLEMPGMNGLDLLACLNDLPASRRPRIIILTASQDRRSVLRAAELGVRHFLVKSTFSLANLLDRVKSVLAESPDAAAPAPTTQPAPARKPAPATPPTAATPPAAPTAPTAPPRAAPNRQPSIAPPSRTSLGDLRPLVSPQDLQRLIQRAGDLRALPPSVAHVLELTDDPTATAEDIAAAIKRDQALALKILKLANSSAYSLGKKTTSVDHAVVRIGMGAIRQALLNIGVVEALGSRSADCPIDPLGLWEHSIACGLIAAEIEQATGGAAPDSAFTAGLLHDAGRLVLAEALGATYREVMLTSSRLRVPLEAAESQLLGLNHAEIMPDLLRRWNLPKELAETIVSHHENPDTPAEPPARAAAVLRLADRLAQSLLLGSSGNETLYPISDLCRQLGLETARLRAIIDSARDQTRDVKIALLASSSETAWPDIRGAWRAKLAGPIRPLCLCASGPIESFHIACETLSTGAPSKPNVGILCFGPADDPAAIAELYKKAQAAAAVKDLPTITISPDARGLDDPAIRTIHTLPTPLSITALLEALNSAISHGSMSRAA